MENNWRRNSEYETMLESEQKESCDPIEPCETTWNRCPNFWWYRPPPEILEQIEDAITERCKTPSIGWYVDIPLDAFEQDQHFLDNQSDMCRIWTRKFQDEDEPASGENLPSLVMIHGFGGGGVHFALNVDGLAKHFIIYTIDFPGFARSSRIKFSSDPVKCEEQLISILELWRQKVGLKRMNLLGHSFGGYICTTYALKFPQRINHLLLGDPWGFNVSIPETESGRIILPAGEVVSRKTLTLMKYYSMLLSPLSYVRLFGRLSYCMVAGHTKRTFKMPSNVVFENEEENLLVSYQHQANLHTPTGESAFCTLGDLGSSYFTSKFPLINRINELDTNIPLTAIFGRDSGIPKITREEFEHARNSEGYSRSRIVSEAGHHVHLMHEEFNHYVIEACKVCNQRGDLEAAN